MNHAMLSDPLSPCEERVLKMSARGLTTAEIASVLKTTAPAVNNMRAEIRLKLDANNGERAIAPAFAYGLLTPEDVL